MAKLDKPWRKLERKTRLKYIKFWQDENPLDDEEMPTVGKKRHKDETSELCRVIYQNVWEPEVEEAVVKIELLDPDLSYEDVMDKVTAAMSADTLVVEVGEKTAMRKRLLNAWQFIRQLKANLEYQNTYRHLLQVIVISLTLIANLTGVMSFQVKKAIDKGLCVAGAGNSLSDLDYQKSVVGVDCAYELSVYSFETTNDVLYLSLFLRWANLIIPLINSFVIALNSLWVPGTKYLKILHTIVAVETEIYKCRAGAGEYSVMSVGGGMSATGAGEEKDGDGENKQAKKQAQSNQNATNPRKVLVTRIEAIWSDLGSSEIRQGMLVKPSDYDLVAVGQQVTTQEHPALYDDGQVLSSGTSTQQRLDVLGRYARTIFDDGLKKLSAAEYIDFRVSSKLKEYEARAPRLGLANNAVKTLIIICTSTSTILGAYDFANWIPVAMGVASALGAISSYTGDIVSDVIVDFPVDSAGESALLDLFDIVFL